MGLLSAIGSVVGGLFGGGSSKKASREAARLQYEAELKGIEENARQFDLTRADFASEQQLGEDAIGGFRGLIGLDGNDAQAEAISALRESPLYQSLMRNGMEATGAALSATGGLRGGNGQRAFFDVGEDVLSDVIRQQISDYSGAIGIGMGSDQALGNFGAQSVRDQNAQRNLGAGAFAQDALIRGGVNAQNYQNLGTAFGELLGKIKF
jgi:hypothetical protein